MSIFSKARRNYAFMKKALGKRREIESLLSYSAGIQATGGTVDEAEFDALFELARKAAAFNGALIEIGTLFGYSTQALALGKRREQELIAVDAFCWNPIGIPPWRHEEMTRKNLTFLTRTQNVKLVSSRSRDFYDAWNGGVPALVFIDAEHGYEAVREDLDWAIAQKPPLICGDDFSFPGVRQAVEESFPGRYRVVGDMWIVEN